jgi:predicted phage replisome organizer
MAENKKYYYLKFKENYFDQDHVRVIESMNNGHEYSLIIIKLYLRSLKFEGQLKITDHIPYTTDKIDLLAGVLNHDPGNVMQAINLAIDFGIISITPNSEIFMTDIQNFIGQSSSEADRIKKYRRKIKKESGKTKKKYLPGKDLNSNEIREKEHSVQMYENCTRKLVQKKIPEKKLNKKNIFCEKNAENNQKNKIKKVSGSAPNGAFDRSTKSVQSLYKCTPELELELELELDNININHDFAEKKSDHKKNKKTEAQDNDQQEKIEELYKLYPTRCPVSKRSTSKSHKDKDKIKKLIKQKGFDTLKTLMQNYIKDCNQTKVYLKNLSSFLNQLPETQPIRAETEEERKRRRQKEIIKANPTADHTLLKLYFEREGVL